MNEATLIILTQILIISNFAYMNYRLDKLEKILKDKNNE